MKGKIRTSHIMAEGFMCIKVSRMGRLVTATRFGVVED